MSEKETMHRYRMLIAYKGTEYCGWQIQPNGVSIQELLQKAIATAIREEVSVSGSGRTDAGVHAMGQVAHFDTCNPVDLHRLLRSLNGLLPEAIRVLHLDEVSKDFHSRFSAIGKVYHYNLCLRDICDPFRRPFTWWIYDELDLDLLERAAREFIGTHDFTSFANSANKGSAAKNPVRTIWRVDVIPQPMGLRLEFEGGGFLYKMVRNIVGTVISVARGKIQLEDIPKIFEAKDRSAAPPAAPPHGLFLMKVIYPDSDS